jgi:hypothetical protein
MSYYLHEVPGRLRVRIPALRRNVENAQEIQGLLKSLSGIISTSVNTMTGSVTVNYDPEFVSSVAILTLLSREGYIDVAEVLSSRNQGKRAEGPIGEVGKIVSKALLGIALDRALQGTPLSILTAFI